MTVKADTSDFLRFGDTKTEIDRGLMAAFKETCERLGVKQAVIIRHLIHDFVIEAEGEG